MSELYLTLRSRLHEVADWVEIPPEVLREARKRIGSRETVARKLNISQKTLERYEHEGRIPRQMVDAFARVLHLQIERPEAQPLTVVVPDEEPGLPDVRKELADVADRLARLERDIGGKLDRLLAQQAPEDEAPPRAKRSR